LFEQLLKKKQLRNEMVLTKCWAKKSRGGCKKMLEKSAEKALLTDEGSF